MSNLQKWHDIVLNDDFQALNSLLAKDCVFFSPLLFKPQKGRKLTAVYLKTAAKVLKTGGFRYVKELDSDTHSILEFACEIDGVKIEGVDIISWNDQGEIIEFKVMLRPFKALEKVGEKMKAELDKMSLFEKAKIALSKS